MLGKRSDQKGFWEADRLYLDHVGRKASVVLWSVLLSGVSLRSMGVGQEIIVHGWGVSAGAMSVLPDGTRVCLSRLAGRNVRS